MRNLWVAFVLLLSLVACMGSPSPEEQGALMLHEARRLYAEARYDAARDTILSMRQRFPMALDARWQAILLMDSIEQQLAGGDTLKQEFFRRKLEHDRQGLGRRIKD